MRTEGTEVYGRRRTPRSILCVRFAVFGVGVILRVYLRTICILCFSSPIQLVPYGITRRVREVTENRGELVRGTRHRHGALHRVPRVPRKARGQGKYPGKNIRVGVPYSRRGSRPDITRGTPVHVLKGIVRIINAHACAIHVRAIQLRALHAKCCP